MDELREIRRRKMEELGQKNMKSVIDRPIEITDKSFDRVVKDHSAVVVDFWAPWCMPCLTLAPVVERIAKKYAGKVVFGKFNVDENQGMPMRFEIKAIPTLLFFKNGKQVDRVVGVVTEEFLEERIKKLLG